MHLLLRQHFYPLLSCSSGVSIHFFIFTRYREWFSVTFSHMQRIFTRTCRTKCFLPPFLSTYLSLGEKNERECGEWYCFSIATGTPLPRHEAQMVLCCSCHQCSLVSSCEFCGIESEYFPYIRGLCGFYILLLTYALHFYLNSHYCLALFASGV